MNISISFKAVAVLFFVCLSQVAFTAQPSVRTRALAQQMQTVDWVDQEIACGKTATGETICAGDESASVFVSQTMDKIKSAVTNDLAGCAFDEDGPKCWRLPTESNAMVDAMPVADAIPSLLKRLNPDSIRTSLQNICGVESSTGNLICYVPAWDQLARRMFRMKPSKAIGAIAVGENKICWQDDGNIKCRDSADTRSSIPAVGITEITLAGMAVCARSSTEATCWPNETSTALPAEFLDAKRWFGSEYSICALTADSRISCFEPTSGGPPSFGAGMATPARFLQPGSDLVDYWNDHQYGMLECALLTDKTITCWSFVDRIERKLDFHGPVTAMLPTSSASRPCVLLEDGQIECRGFDGGAVSLMKGSVVHYDGRGSKRCSWNSSGVSCTSTPSIPLNNMTALALSENAVCAAGTETNTGSVSNGVWCQDSGAIVSHPITLANPTLLAISEDSKKVCAASDGALQCGGDSFSGVSAPNTLDKPSKLLIKDSYGCVLDLYGLVCWGDLTAKGLQIPTGLNSANRIHDFALGTDSICAVLDDGTARCWGSASISPPKLTGANSIAGYADSFCATDKTGLHCWGGNISLPE